MIATSITYLVAQEHINELRRDADQRRLVGELMRSRRAASRNERARVSSKTPPAGATVRRTSPDDGAVGTPISAMRRIVGLAWR